MGVVLRQSATAATGNPTTATWPLGAPLQGSLLVAIAFDRLGNNPTFPVGWTIHVDRRTLIFDTGSRRELAVATRVADASEPATVEVGGTAGSFRLTICELEPTAGETFTFLEAASNDNGAINNASSIATGTTVDTGSGPRLVIGAFGGRIGPSSPLLQGTSAWTNSLGDIVNHAGGGNDRATSFAFAVHGTGGTKSSTATTDPDPNENTGLSAAVLAFDTGTGITVDVDHGLVMNHQATVDTGVTEITVDVAHGLLMGHLVAVDTEPPPAPTPPLPGIQAEQLTARWTPDGGTTRVLTRGGGHAGQITKPGVIGLDLPPDAQFEQELAAGDGSILTGRRRLPRELIFGVWLRGDTLTEFETRRRQLALDFDPKRDGTFVWALPDGTSRSLRCRTTEYEPEHGHRASLQLQGRWRIVLRARDPYWLGEERGTEFSAPSGDNFYGGAGDPPDPEGQGAPPYIISESTVFGQTVVTVGGDEDTWPVWELHGPMTTATLDNLTSGKSLNLTPNLLVGETLTVRTDPRVIASQKFTRETGANVWSDVAGQFPELWPLLPGAQTLDVTADGSDPNTLIVLRYQARFLTA